MEIYKIPIELAFMFFPLIAFILTVPFLLHQYRKYGAIPILKSFIFYSLILYLICAYFLVMLPLPSIDVVEKLSTPKIQLIPFNFIKDILITTNFKITSISQLIEIFKQSTIYTVLFNVILTLPFGVYLRYFYNKKWYQTIIYTFLLSLFFELTQLSGLYGIYPRPYRLFDVDDLLINTFGGFIGYFIAPLFTIFLPTKEELEEKSYKKGLKVSMLRRFVSFSIDFFFLGIVAICSKIATYGLGLSEYSSIIALVIYYLFIPLLYEGQTIGKKLIRLKLTGIEGNITIFNKLTRYILFSFLTIFPYLWISPLKDKIDTEIIQRLWIIILIYEFINILYYIVTFFKGTPFFLYERVTNTKNVSIIENVNKDKNKKEDLKRKVKRIKTIKK